MKQTLKIILLSALATAALIKGVPALAEPGDQVVAIVRTADLDLSRDSDRRILERRIAVAAHSVCNGASAVDLRGRNAEAGCREQVVEQAKARVRHAAKSNRPIVVAARR